MLGCAGEGEKKDQASDQISNWLPVLQYLEQNKLDEAEAALKKIIEINPDDPAGYADLALVYLKQGEYAQAEEQLNQALKLDADNPEYLLILADVHRQNGDSEQAVRTLKELLQKAPNAKAYYMLFEIYSGQVGKEQEQKTNLAKITEMLPANVVPLTELIDLEARQSQLDSCLQHLERLREVLPELPEQAKTAYEQTVTSIRKKDADKTGVALQQFFTLIKVTPAYTTGLQEVQSPGMVTGNPIFNTDQIRVNTLKEGASLMDIMQFSDASDAIGLSAQAGDKAQSSVVAITDYNGDGELDIYYSYRAPGATSSTHYLFTNELGSYTDRAAEAHLDHSGIERAATFTDYNNDGNMDLFVSTDRGNKLYENLGDGSFADRTDESGISGKGGGNDLIMADLDQEGDLDLLVGRDGPNEFMRNNADGTFTEQASSMGLTGTTGNTMSMDFADLDNDGDLDVVAVDKQGGVRLYTNDRHARFRDVASSAGLNDLPGEIGAVALGDYNNDGMTDLCVANSSGYAIYQNQWNGTFTLAGKASFKSPGGIDVHDASFLDFDNDGHLDFVIVGTARQPGEQGVFLFHNNTKGGFEDVSDLWPETAREGFNIQIGDFNNDGDQDIFLAGPNGIRLIRNDTGNLNNFIQLRLVGLSYGNSKNNRLGIGAQVSMRAGDLFQMRTMTEPVIHFGLGERRTVDIMRVIWPNGVPQNFLDPKSKDDFVEEQMLKGSCPFLFTWNGHKYEFQKDMMWRSALGMPLAVQGRDTTYAFADVSREYLKIPGEKLKPKDGLYSIKITEELWEAVYFDKASLIAVDHPADVDMFVDERFKLPPFPGRDLYSVREKNLPVSAQTGQGLDVLPRISAYDFDYVSDFQLGKYQGIAEDHSLILDLGDKARTDSLYLYLRGWVFPPDASINLALTQTEAYKLAPPSLEVRNARGDWEVAIPDLGYPMGKDKMVIANLSGKFPTDDRHVRIRTNMQIYWDHIFFTNGQVNAPMKMHDLKMVQASLDYRGYSASYRKGGRYGPHWFDHDRVTTGQKWRDLTGFYTRYGDVLPLLQKGDDQYIIANSGDEITIGFDAENLPELPQGWKRDFLIYSEGWVKDGDLNTMHGQTVEPLPFHGMKAYPYSKDVHYPTDAGHEAYRKKYNTRKVTTDGFKDALKPDA